MKTLKLLEKSQTKKVNENSEAVLVGINLSEPNNLLNGQMYLFICVCSVCNENWPRLLNVYSLLHAAHI